MRLLHIDFYAINAYNILGDQMTSCEQNIKKIETILAQKKQNDQNSKHQLVDNCAKLAEYFELHGMPEPGIGLVLPLRQGHTSE